MKIAKPRLKRTSTCVRIACVYKVLRQTYVGKQGETP